MKLSGKLGRNLVVFCVALVAIFTFTAVKTSIVSERYLEPDTHGVNGDVSVLGEIPRMQAAYVHKGAIYAVEERSVYVSRDEGESFEPVGYLPRDDKSFSGLIKGWVARNDLVRGMRKTPGAPSMVVLSSGTILVVSDRVYRKSPSDKDFTIVKTGFKYLPPFESGRSIAVGPDDTVYFGEYTKGPHPSKMRIFRGRNDGRLWEEAYSFPKGLIYHVHSIAWDKYRYCFWVSTGDADGESHIFYTEDDFKTLSTLGGGSQDWRAVALLVREQRLVWGSDDGRDTSSIFAWDFTKGALIELAEIGNPASYVGALEDGTLMVTTSYIPVTEFGETGEAAPEAALWASANGSNWKKVFTLQAAADLSGDKRPQLRLPGGDESLPFAFISPMYTMHNDFSVLKAELVSRQ